VFLSLTAPLCVCSLQWQFVPPSGNPGFAKSIRWHGGGPSLDQSSQRALFEKRGMAIEWGKIWRCPKMGIPHYFSIYLSILDWDFPWNKHPAKPSSVFGDPTWLWKAPNGLTRGFFQVQLGRVARVDVGRPGSRDCESHEPNPRPRGKWAKS